MLHRLEIYRDDIYAQKIIQTFVDHMLNSTYSIIISMSGFIIADFCQWETFNATCNENSVIVMTMANYGRMNTGRCVSNDRGGNIGCQQVRLS